MLKIWVVNISANFFIFGKEAVKFRSTKSHAFISNKVYWDFTDGSFSLQETCCLSGEEKSKMHKPDSLKAILFCSL